MGYDFWQDAKQYEDKISQELNIGKVDHEHEHGSHFLFGPSHMSRHCISEACH